MFIAQDRLNASHGLWIPTKELGSPQYNRKGLPGNIVKYEKQDTKLYAVLSFVYV